MLGFGWLGCFSDLWIPAFAGMTAGAKVRRDPLAAIHAWFRMARLFSDLWIPAFAGMAGERESERRLSFLTPLSSLFIKPLSPIP